MEVGVGSVAWLALLVVAVAVVGFVAARALRGPSARRIPDEPPPVSFEPPPAIEPAAGTRYPVVLLHGAFGFEALSINNERHAYFFGVRERLESKGIEVFSPEVPPVAGIRTRAKHLVHRIAALGAPRVNVIAHSMGGLDTRYAIAHLGLHERVASLVTVGTPHHGTPLANISDGVSGTIGVRRMLGHVGEMMRDLTTRRMAVFNEDTPDHPDVFYASVVGRARRLADVHPLLVPSWRWLVAQVGDNDGIIPAASQEWGELLFIVDVDHWAQVGWSRSPVVETTQIYEAIADALGERGF